jgi:hypothetical protein
MREAQRAGSSNDNYNITRVINIGGGLDVCELKSCANMELLKIPVHVEVVLSPHSQINIKEYEIIIRDYLLKKPVLIDGIIDISGQENEFLSSVIQSITICDIGNQEISYWKAGFIFHFYKLHQSGPEKDFLDGEEELPACDHWELPNQNLSNLWESIVCSGEIKRHLLGYASSAMIFTHANVNSDIISWNRMILLHGPPGVSCLLFPFHFYQENILCHI